VVKPETNNPSNWREPSRFKFFEEKLKPRSQFGLFKAI